MIKIIAVGSLKEGYLRGGVSEYLKRLQGYDRVEIIEIKAITKKDPDLILKQEASSILAQVAADEYLITLDLAGQELSSEQLAQMIETKRSYGLSKITFVIGGSLGLGDAVKKRSNLALSFSRLTFPHQLIRLILLEQIYRAFTIINHQEYHK